MHTLQNPIVGTLVQGSTKNPCLTAGLMGENEFACGMKLDDVLPVRIVYCMKLDDVLPVRIIYIACTFDCIIVLKRY